MPRSHQHWLYVWIPLVTATIWFGTLLAMLITWLAQGRPHYVSQDGSIAYISDVGADILKPLFVTGCCITGVGFFLSLVVERWLRHSGRLIPEMRRRERVLSCLAILGSFIGGAGLILLSIFDTKRHPSLHRVFLLVFIVGVGLSAIFTVIEYRWISKDFTELRKLKFAYVMKGVIATLLILCAIAFAIALFEATDVGAVLEWTIAFGYTFYLLTFFFDLRMAKGVHRGQLAPSQIRNMQQQGIPVSTATAGHEGNFGIEGGEPRASNDTYNTFNTFNGRQPLLHNGQNGQPTYPKTAYYAPNGRAANYPA
ncbi:Frag1/DRAM/Sfk1 family-domain-containing protein [Cytidiella melzeri]|nr:Frag1/DRAM/Sfk1 family-domain-containing protein [Cytidiella melzeri]